MQMRIGRSGSHSQRFPGQKFEFRCRPASHGNGRSRDPPLYDARLKCCSQLALAAKRSRVYTKMGGKGSILRAGNSSQMGTSPGKCELRPFGSEWKRLSGPEGSVLESVTYKCVSLTCRHSA